MATELLERALLVCRRLDPACAGKLTIEEWPCILDALEIDDSSDECAFLMEHLAPSGEGEFTYCSILDALGYNQLPCDNNSYSPRGAGSAKDEPRVEHLPLRPYGNDGSPCNSNPFEQGNTESTWQNASSTGDCRQIQSPNSLHCGQSQDLVSEYSSPCDEVDETYWARRAGSIQQLYTKWDRNELSNAGFVEKLQKVLGDAVDVSGPDSEFVKLTNKHRCARNMKFAALMSALRRDVQTTSTRRFGRPLDKTGLSSYAGSYAGSQYEPSLAGSEVQSSAAGRPSRFAESPGLWQSGRRHYSLSKNQMKGAVVAGVPPRSPTSDSTRDVQAWNSRTPDATDLRTAIPEDDAGMVKPDSASCADSQRELFMLKNQTGHGNILTWGANSRSITPPRQRHIC